MQNALNEGGVKPLPLSLMRDGTPNIENSRLSAVVTYLADVFFTGSSMQNLVKPSITVNI